MPPARYPGTVDGDGTEPDRTRPSWPMIAVVAVIALVLAVIVIAHLTGAIGPGVHPPSS